jgi:hypothetical protein
MTDFSQDGCLNQAYVTATKHTDFHGLLLPRSTRKQNCIAMFQFIYCLAVGPCRRNLTLSAMTGSVTAIFACSPFVATSFFKAVSFD